MSLSVTHEWTIPSSPWLTIERPLRSKIKKILIAFFGLKGLIDHEFFTSKPWHEPYCRKNCSAVPSRSSFSEKDPKLSFNICLCTTNFALSRGTDYHWILGQAQRLSVSPSAYSPDLAPLRFSPLSQAEDNPEGEEILIRHEDAKEYYTADGHSAKDQQHLHWKVE